MFLLLVYIQNKKVLKKILNFLNPAYSPPCPPHFILTHVTLTLLKTGPWGEGGEGHVELYWLSRLRERERGGAYMEEG